MTGRRERTDLVRASLSAGNAAGANALQRARALGTWRLHVLQEADSAILRWRYTSDAVPDTTQGRWTVERSGSPAGPFQDLPFTLPGAARSFRDDAAAIGMQPNKALYYRIRFDSDTGSESFGLTRPWDWAEGVYGVSWGAPNAHECDAPGVVREVRKRHFAMLSRRSAEMALLYRDRWDAPIDPLQVNPRTGSLRVDFVPNPHATNHVGGFYNPIEVIVSSAAGPVGAEIIPAIMCYWPPPFIGDRLRTWDNRVYEITGIEPNVMYDYPTHYAVELTDTTEHSLLTQVPMPTGYERVSPFARKQFSRSANLQSYRKSLEYGSLSTASAALPDSTEEP